MTKEEFEQVISILSELSRVSLMDRAKQFYWAHIRHIPYDEIKPAINLFCSRGKMPTVEELLRECGRTGVQDAEERLMEEATPEFLKKSPKSSIDNALGHLTVCIDANDVQDNEEAEVTISNKIAELCAKGWIVIDMSELFMNTFHSEALNLGWRVTKKRFYRNVNFFRSSIDGKNVEVDSQYGNFQRWFKRGILQKTTEG